MKKIIQKIISGIFITVMMTGVLGGCGAKEEAATDYTIWLYQAQDSSYYLDYSENPVLRYLMEKEWNGKTLNLEFIVPPAGSAQQNYNTMISTSDFPTLMQNSVSDPAPIMYEEGCILDITDLVKEYMPNYYKLIQTNETLRSNVVFEIDGEEKILSIATLNESTPYTYAGMVYRRDWIVKYGTNPFTGEAFMGGYTDEKDPDSYVDNVVFPSGGTEPVYISDWEWMFEIFSKAQQALGIESYCISVYYPGYTWAGGLCSCFGEGGIVWYQAEDGEVRFGGTEESTRAYFECLNSWYKKGWLDKRFNERVSDQYYSIDSSAVRSGEVGMWCGLESDLGGRLDLNDGGATEGIFVAGCAYPINDIYGAEECKYVEPRVMNVDDSLVSTGFFVMDGAQEKDLASLFTMLDYLYIEEGAILRTLGMNQEQLKESGSTFYSEYGMEDGAYTLSEDGRIVKCDTLRKDSGGLSVAVSLDRLPGLQLISSIDEGYADTYEASLKSWIKYTNKGRLWGSTAMLNMSSEDNATAQDALSKVINYMEANAYKFIKGEKSIKKDSTDWNEWCSYLKRFKYDDVSELLQRYVDLYPLTH